MNRSALSPYPVDLWPLLARMSEKGTSKKGKEEGQASSLRGGGIEARLNASPLAEDHPARVAQRALVCWNAFLQRGDEGQRATFLECARWLLACETRLTEEAGGWPVLCALPMYRVPQICLSALTQGCALSVCARAYQLTGERTFWRTAQRAARPFARDILDGGVSATLFEEGLFFEETAVYPAAHSLSGHMLALLGLYDYVELTREKEGAELIRRGLLALHKLLDAFDTGYWTHADLLSRCLASETSHAFHTALLAALADLSACVHCAELAARWRDYQRRLGSRLRGWLTRGLDAAYSHTLQAGIRRLVGASPVDEDGQGPARVCVPIPQFPVPGGMRGVLAGVAQVMEDQWRMGYLTNYRGQDAAAHLEIETFGHRLTHPWQFPGVWLYSLAGLGKLQAALRRNPRCHLVLPQDGVFTGAFAALVGKLAGRRVVCMDHGNVTWLDNPALRRERMQRLQNYPRLRRLFARLRFALYWASLPLLARLAVRWTDLFLVAGDEVEEVYRRRLGVHASRIVRYAYMVDVARFPRLEVAARLSLRAERGIAAETILITMINRLATEKGMDIALAGIARALSQLPPEVRGRVRILIAGDGPLRTQVQEDIQRYGLAEVCLLWGEARPAEVVTLLSIADIFLYSGTRGTNYSMAVLEAMAAGCAVVASSVPRSNVRLLAEGRGIALAPGDTDALADALVRLCREPEQCQRMGDLARDYVATYHTAAMLRRNLWRATFFVPCIGD